MLHQGNHILWECRCWQRRVEHHGGIQLNPVIIKLIPTLLLCSLHRMMWLLTSINGLVWNLCRLSIGVPPMSCLNSFTNFINKLFHDEVLRIVECGTITSTLQMLVMEVAICTEVNITTSVETSASQLLHRYWLTHWMTVWSVSHQSKQGKGLEVSDGIGLPISWLDAGRSFYGVRTGMSFWGVSMGGVGVGMSCGSSFEQSSSAASTSFLILSRRQSYPWTADASPHWNGSRMGFPFFNVRLLKQRMNYTYLLVP